MPAPVGSVTGAAKKSLVPATAALHVTKVVECSYVHVGCPWA